jgi:predicted dehydrogenase
MTHHAPLRAAFIGGSIQSAVGYAHYAAARMDGRFDITAGCFSRNPAINRATAESYSLNLSRLYPDWRLLLQAEAQNIDVAIILTPTPAHVENVAACLKAGIPVICEKALAATAGEAERLLDLQRAERGFLAVTFNYSGYPMVRELRSMIEGGKLGRILHIEAEMPQEGFIRRNGDAPAAQPQEWRLRDGEIPTLHLDLGVHLHQLVYYLTRFKPLEVSATQDRFGCFENVADTVSALARYEGGAAAHFWFSKAALGHRNGLRIRLYGERAAAEWTQGEPELLHLSHSNGQREILDRGGEAPIARAARYTRFKAGHPAGYIEAFANLYTDIADALLAHKAGKTYAKDEVFGAELAAEGLYFMHAMTESASMKSWRTVQGQTHIAARAREAA